uniref:Ig-like domain-containing protein n=1 Tax=Bradyrhizobium liaoningense TaxID=43992 RepID=UPI0018731760
MSIIQSSFAYSSNPNHDDIISDGQSYYPSVSSDGNYVVYTSGASNLVAGDTNSTSDVFLYNRITNHIDIISIADTGEPANGFSGTTAGRQISADGRYSVFYSYATNLVSDPHADGSHNNIYVYDRDAPLHHVSRIPTERIIDFNNSAHQIIHTTMSADGSSVFLSDDSGNLFRYGLAHDSFEQIPIGAGIGEFSLSENGRYIAYDFLSGYGRGIYVYDLVDHTTQTVISGEQIGTLLSYAGTAIHPTISADGRYVAFELTGPFANIGNNSPEVYLWDRDGDFPPVLVSHRPDGGLQNAAEAHTNLSPTATADGHYVLFGSDANDLGGQFTNSANLYSYNVLDGTVTFLYGPTPTHHDYHISASYDGRYVSFTTSDGVYGYITGRDVFLLDQGPVGINHPPITSNISTNANEDTNGLPVTLAALFTDADLSDTFTFSADVAGTVGLVTNNNDGTFTYDPNRKFESLAVGETATDTFRYTLTDHRGASSTAMATITIHGENDLPSALPDAVVAQKGTVTTVNAAHGVLVNDSDPDKHDALHVSSANGLAANVGHLVVGTYGSLTLNADGSYSYAANKNVPGLTNKGGVQDVFTYAVDDGHGGTASSSLTVTVQTQNALNSGPVLSIKPLDANKDEGNSGSTPFTFVVTRDGNATGTTSADWIVGPANGVTSDSADFTGGAFPTGTVTFNTGELTKTITVNVQGDTLYESKGKPENFTVTLSNPSSGATLAANHDSAVGHIRNDDAPLKTAAKLFAALGTDGEIVALAQLAQAAYHLVPNSNIEKAGAGINLPDRFGDAAYASLPAGMQVLTPSDLPSLTPQSVIGDPYFPTFGLVDGIYLDGNAAALIAQSSDSLFVAFRGTNDSPNILQDVAGGLSGHGGTPDSNDWSVLGGMPHHYDLLRPLVTAIDHYLSTHADITLVYVTGHSLGASMAQRFMSDDILDNHAQTSFQAVTFANPGFGFSTSVDDPRITNIDILGDPVLGLSPYAVELWRNLGD